MTFGHVLAFSLGWLACQLLGNALHALHSRARPKVAPVSQPALKPHVTVRFERIHHRTNLQ